METQGGKDHSARTKYSHTAVILIAVVPVGAEGHLAASLWSNWNVMLPENISKETSEVKLELLGSVLFKMT